MRFLQSDICLLLVVTFLDAIRTYIYYIPAGLVVRPNELDFNKKIEIESC